MECPNGMRSVCPAQTSFQGRSSAPRQRCLTIATGHRPPRDDRRGACRHTYPRDALTIRLKRRANEFFVMLLAVNHGAIEMTHAQIRPVPN
jgi:hypothetical protein